jgi:hypothetical protein
VLNLFIQSGKSFIITGERAMIFHLWFFLWDWFSFKLVEFTLQIGFVFTERFNLSLKSFVVLLKFEIGPVCFHQMLFKLFTSSLIPACQLILQLLHFSLQVDAFDHQLPVFFLLAL